MTTELNGYTCEFARVTMPRVGVWHTDVMLDDEVNLSGRVQLDINGELFAGTIHQGRPFAGSTPIRIVGGGGTLSRKIDPKNYRSPNVLSVVREIIGPEETLSATADSGVLNSSLPNYHLVEGLASHALTTLLEKVGATWRVLPDGTIWIGKDTYPEVELEHVVEDEDWFGGTITILPETPSLLPGTTFRGFRIEEVVHWSSRKSLRTEARLTSAASALGTFLSQIRRAVDYAKLWPARVSKVNADGTLQLVPDDSRIKGTGMDKVRIRPGVPGKIVPIKGARCLVGFEEGDPSQPYATGWENGDVKEIVFADGFADIARVGSTANVFFPQITPIQGTLAGQPFVGVLQIATPGIAIIQDGNPKLKG